MKNPSDFSRGVNYCSKICGESSHKANYHLKNHVDQNNWCHKNAGKFCGNILSSKISWKSHEMPGISSKFVCITIAQYCTSLGFLSFEFFSVLFFSFSFLFAQYCTSLGFLIFEFFFLSFFSFFSC